MIGIRRLRGWLALPTIVMGLLALPQLASAAGWTSQEMPAPTGQRPAVSKDVSCSSTSQCTAVGYSVGERTFRHQLVDAWNGTAWTIQTVSEPPKALGSELRGVTCRSASFCVGVGHYEVEGTGTGALAEFWNGTSWSFVAPESPSGAVSATLNSVDCPSTTECVAVGQQFTHESKELPLIESWNGSKWRIETAAVPKGAKYVHLTGISCGSQPGCMAVGNSEESSSGHPMPLVEIRGVGGSAWGELHVQLPASSGGWGGEISDVSCISESECTLAGTTYEYGEARPLIANWKRSVGEMTVEQIPVELGIKHLWLTSVSCVGTTTECFVVGEAETTSNKAGILVPVGYDRMTMAKGWQTTNPWLPGAGSGWLNAISCRSMVNCKATGVFVTEKTSEEIPLADRFQ